MSSNLLRTEGKTKRAPLTVYVASPLGFTESTRTFMNEKLVPTLKKLGVATINPWDPDPELEKLITDAKGTRDLPSRQSKWRKVVTYAGRKNAESISRADGIVAVLEGIDVDSGTAAEIGYGSGLKKWVIGYREDLRRTGEDETSEVNLQVEYFITHGGGVITHNLEELKQELEKRNR